MSKKFLFEPDLPKDKKILKKVFEEFTAKAFLTDDELILLLDDSKETYHYLCFLMRTVFCGSCKIRYFFKSKIVAADLLAQVDFVITAGNDFEENAGVPVIDATKSKQIFESIEPNEDVKKVRENFETTVQEKIFKLYPPNQWEYFLFHEGIGESLSFFFWMKEYKKKHKKRILFLCFDKIRAELFQRCPYVGNVFTISQVLFDYISIYFAKKYNIRRVLQAHFTENILKNKKNIQYYDFPEMMRDWLGISPKIKFERYSVPLRKENVDNAQKAFEELNLTKGKAVFILPEGIFFSGLKDHYNFWIKLANRMKSAGYEVVTNSKEPMFSDCKNVFLSLFDSVAFAGLCGNMVTVASGFFEALLTLNSSDKIKAQFVFPNQSDPYWMERRDEGERWIKSFSMRMDKYCGSNIDFDCEQWGNNETEDDALIEKIFMKFVS